MERFRDAVRDALDGRTLTREELIAAVTVVPGLEHIADGLRSGWGTLLKPIAWQGDLCFGPQAGNRVTFMRPDQASRRWAGIPDPDVAGPQSPSPPTSRAYGPATAAGFRNWLSRGLVPAKRVEGWFADLGDRLTPIDGRRRAGLDPVRGSRRAGRDEAVADRPVARRLRPVGPRPRHGRPARDRPGEADRRQPAERLDRPDRRGRGASSAAPGSWTATWSGSRGSPRPGSRRRAARWSERRNGWRRSWTGRSSSRWRPPSAPARSPARHRRCRS